ncbi:hypothetical protein PIROE2DRAFT_5832, partial [Piromyces sp. E2]
SNGGKTLPKIKKEYASTIISDDDNDEDEDEETYTVLASGKSSYTSEVISKGYSNGSIHKSTGGKVKPGSLNRNNSYSVNSYGNGPKSNSKSKKGSIDGSKNKSDTNHNKNLLDSLLTDDDEEDLDEISSLTSMSSSADEEVVIMASDHI